MRARFNDAWLFVPPDVRARLGPRLVVCAFSRQRRPYGMPYNHAVYGPKLRTGFAIESKNRRRVFVFLRTSVERGSRQAAIALVLHELAHAARFAAGVELDVGWEDEREADRLATVWLRSAGPAPAVKCASIAVPYPLNCLHDDAQEDAYLRGAMERAADLDHAPPPKGPIAWKGPDF